MKNLIAMPLLSWNIGYSETVSSTGGTMSQWVIPFYEVVVPQV
jgi:hypothetical protein